MRGLLMLNVQELERQWLRYKIKSFLPKILSVLAVFIVSIIMIIIFSKEDTPTPTTSNVPIAVGSIQPNNAKQQSQKNELHVVDNENVSSSVSNLEKTKEVTQKEISHSQIVLAPSLDFIDTLKDMPKENVTKFHIQPVEEKEVELKVEEHKNIPKIAKLNKPKTTENIVTDNSVVESYVLENETENKIKSSNFSINIKEEEADIQEVITRFKNNKNPALSLFVAKRFYAIKNYPEAYNYALLTNNINSDIEESWLIAAKSLNKLGKKEESIRLLNQFIGKSHSIRGTMILEQIKNGTL
jgi:tetratricopeptide (TPR) repeat protein